MIKLDDIDLSILNNLQQNGRMTNIELANKIGLSAPPCLRRLKTLEKRGIIKGYYAEIDSKIMGYDLQCICLVSLKIIDKDSINKFVGYINAFPSIRSCARTIGESNFILKILAKDFEDYQKIEKYLYEFADILSIKAHILTETHKNELGVPIN